MREITLHIDLHFLKQAGTGFITDELSGQAKLHRVNCPYIDTVSATLVQMVFFETCPEATQWLNDKHWSSCEKCAPRAPLHGGLGGTVA